MSSIKLNFFLIRIRLAQEHLEYTFLVKKKNNVFSCLSAKKAKFNLLFCREPERKGQKSETFSGGIFPSFSANLSSHGF